MTLGFRVTRVKAITVLEYLMPEEYSWFVFPRHHQNCRFNLNVSRTAAIDQDRWMCD